MISLKENEIGERRSLEKGAGWGRKKAGWSDARRLEVKNFACQYGTMSSQ
jgi:hypothetical protein